MTSSQQDTTSSCSFADKMTGSGGAQNSVLSYQQLLHPIRCADLCNRLNGFRVVVAAITTNDKKSALSTLRNGKEDARHKSFRVVRLLEDDYFLTKTRTISHQS